MAVWEAEASPVVLQEVERWEYKVLDAVSESELAKLDAGGWKLVAVASGHAVFKRPK